MFRIACGRKKTADHFGLGMLLGQFDYLVRGCVKSHMQLPHLIFWNVAGAAIVAVSGEKFLSSYPWNT